VRVIFTPLAERNINSLHEYIAEHTSEERADGYVGRIVDFCNGLSTFPLRGTQRDVLLSGLRVTGFERRVTIAFIVTAGGRFGGHISTFNNLITCLASSPTNDRS